MCDLCNLPNQPQGAERPYIIREIVDVKKSSYSIPVLTVMTELIETRTQTKYRVSIGFHLHRLFFRFKRKLLNDLCLSAVRALVKFLHTVYSREWWR